MGAKGFFKSLDLPGFFNVTLAIACCYLVWELGSILLTTIGWIDDGAKPSSWLAVGIVAWAMMAGSRKVYLSFVKFQGDIILQGGGGLAPFVLLILAVEEGVSVGSVGPIGWYDVALGAYIVVAWWAVHFVQLRATKLGRDLRTSKTGS